MLTNAAFKGNAVPRVGSDSGHGMFKTDAGRYVRSASLVHGKQKGEKAVLHLSGDNVLAVSWA